MAWYQELTTYAQILFWIAVVASVFVVVQIIMLLISFGGGDLDADGDFDMDGDMDTDGGLALFSTKSVTAFFALGGWCGFAVASYLPDNYWLPVIVAVVTGTIALFGVAFIMKGVAKLQCSGNINAEKLQGSLATVYVSVPENRSGRGKITLTAQGRYMEIDAMTEGDRIATDEQVKILSYDGDFALVERQQSARTEEENK